MIRSIIKSITHRILSSTATFLVAYFVTDTFQFAAEITGIEVLLKLVIYYLHEIVWEKQSDDSKVTIDKLSAYGTMDTSGLKEKEKNE